MEEARQAMAAGNHPQAIQIYTKVLEHQDTGKHQDAQEFLALAANATDKSRMPRWSTSVICRLIPQVKARIACASACPPSSRRVRSHRTNCVNPARTGRSGVDVNGSFSQFYRRDTSHIVEQENVTNSRTDETRVNMSALSNDLDINGRRRGGRRISRHALPVVMNTTFFPKTRARATSVASAVCMSTIRRTCIRSARVSSTDPQHRRCARALRWRADELSVKPTVKLNAVTGFPVDSSKDNVKTDRYFYGVSADFGTYADAWILSRS